MLIFLERKFTYIYLLTTNELLTTTGSISVWNQKNNFGLEM
jgi:hypothetical protein